MDVFALPSDNQHGLAVLRAQEDRQEEEARTRGGDRTGLGSRTVRTALSLYRSVRALHVGLCEGGGQAPLEGDPFAEAIIQTDRILAAGGVRLALRFFSECEAQCLGGSFRWEDRAEVHHEGDGRPAP